MTCVYLNNQQCRICLHLRCIAQWQLINSGSFTNRSTSQRVRRGPFQTRIAWCPDAMPLDDAGRRRQAAVLPVRRTEAVWCATLSR